MFDFSGKVALVTGASGGIGRAIAAGLHGRGATVVLTGTREAVLAEVAASLGGERTHVIAADLSQADAADTLIKAVEAAAGGVDILVNNAGLTRDQLLLRLKDADWAGVLDVNLTAPMRLSRAVLKGMMKKRFGRIISITSIVGATGNAGQTNYAASKAGLVGFSKSLAQEVASRNITVNCVAPGFIETAMTEALGDEQKQKLLGGIPLGRMGTGEEIAAAVVYLASSEAGYVTGETLHVNGGMAML